MSGHGPGQVEPTDNFRERVLAIVRRIPRGKVLTYGQVAILAGVPRAARIVGGILFSLGPRSRLPWQRVINFRGGISTYRVGSGDRQRELLEREGLRFDRRGCVDLKTSQWVPNRRTLVALGVLGKLPEWDL
jgi:methylated-DNA-protein-cysteine methyltransferase related protein